MGTDTPSRRRYGRRLRAADPALQERLGSAIYAARKAQGITMEALAERCEISTSTISLVENLRIEPRWRHVVALARVLGLSLDEIAGRRR